MKATHTPSNPRGRHPITVEAKILVFLQYLANKCTIRGIAALFGLSESTEHQILATVSGAICDLSSAVIKWPVAAEQLAIAEAFMQERDVPQCIGAIDGTHIECIPA